jgi:predicted alpha/beta superfamily hydrolase
MYQQEQLRFGCRKIMIPQEKYPVLYMHDGQNLFDSTVNWNHEEWKVDETITKLTRAE